MEQQGDDDRRITYFASTHTRGKREIFGIRAIDRGKHVYAIGKTGMGKSTMLENMAIQDIQNGEGIAYIDPHGSTAEKLLDFVPHERIKDVLYFAPFDINYPIGFNVMEDVGYDKRHLVVSGLMGAFRRIWVDAWSARMEYILQNTLLALLEYPGSTLLDVNRMLVNKEFRKAVTEKITDPVVRSFWVEEFAGYTDRYTQDATPAIQNKVGQFVANPLVRNIVGQSTSSFDLRKMMDEKKIFIVNLSKGRMGETNASLLGSMLVVKIYLAAMSRADEPPLRMARLPYCYFYVDEFQSMMNEAFADILSESRKYKLALTLANQYIEQMEENVRNAVFGNIGTLVCFRVGPFDAEVLKTVFEPTFFAEDLVGLGLGQIYLTLMIDGVGSAPFSAETVPPIEPPPVSYREDVINFSRSQFAKRREDVESSITARQMEFQMPPKKERPPRDFGGGERERRPMYDDRPPRPIQRREFENKEAGPYPPPRREFSREAPRNREFPSPPRRPERVAPIRDDASRFPVQPAPNDGLKKQAGYDLPRPAIASVRPMPEKPLVEKQKSPADILREQRVHAVSPTPQVQHEDVKKSETPKPQPPSTTVLTEPKEISTDVLRGILGNNNQ